MSSARYYCLVPGLSSILKLVLPGSMASAAPRPQQMALSKVLDEEEAAGAELSTQQILAGEGDDPAANTQALYGAPRPPLAAPCARRFPWRTP
jgi:hypothetical protein